MELNIKIIYEGKRTLKKFRHILAKTAIDLDGGKMDDGDCVRNWDGWIRVGEKTTLISKACVICFLNNMKYILEKREGILVEINLTSKSF